MLHRIVSGFFFPLLSVWKSSMSSMIIGFCVRNAFLRYLSTNSFSLDSIGVSPDNSNNIEFPSLIQDYENRKQAGLLDPLSQLSFADYCAS